MLGGVDLLFDEAEIEVLSLCAWCKDLPIRNSRNIPAEILEVLQFLGLIRHSRNGLGYRCTPKGYEVLGMAGKEYVQDKSYRSDCDVLERRYQTAEITSFFWRYGADVFCNNAPGSISNNIFLPSFALRRQKHANILGGTKLMGFYYSKEITFIPYYITADNNGIYTDVEQRTFMAETLRCGKTTHIIYTGEGDLVDIINFVECQKERSRKVTTDYYIDALYKFDCPKSIIPLTDDGMRQLRILEIQNYREVIAKNILGKRYSSPINEHSDGRSQTEEIIVGIDCNIARIKEATKSKVKTSIFVLPFQAEAIQRIVKDSNSQCYVLNLEETEEYLSIPHELPDINREPFQTEKGDYIYVPTTWNNKKVRR